jgi:predicted nucleic acid-binding protein
VTRYVVDAGIIVKWFVVEEYNEEAKRVRREEYELHVPDQMFAEVGNVLWKKNRAGDLSALDAVDILDSVGGFGFQSHASWPLVVHAIDIALQTGIAVYDGLYVGLARELDCELVTADRRLYNLLRGTDLEKRLLWIEDIPEA